MTGAGLLDEIKNAAKYGDIITRRYSDGRMAQRSLKNGDIKNGILSATRVIEQPNGRFRLEGGCDLAEEPLVVVVEQHRRGLVLVTAF